MRENNREERERSGIGGGGSGLKLGMEGVSVVHSRKMGDKKKSHEKHVRRNGCHIEDEGG